MAFSARNLSPSGDNAKNGVVPCLWTFWNEDADTVTSALYLTGQYGNIKVGDQVMVIDGDYGNMTNYHVTVSTTVGATIVINS